ncbi:MAG: AraC family transcriptional regulator [Clostridia bacterium]|nr:AraC family transcriptional regulator [Clostridia bacterium]
MERLVFGQYHLKHLLHVDSLSTAHYLLSVSQFATPPHSHEAWELVYCSHGAIDAYEENSHYQLRAHQIVFHRPDSKHHLSITGTRTTAFVFSFFCRSEYMRLLSNVTLDTDSAQESLLEMIIQELINAFDLDDGHLMLGEFHPSNHAALGAEHLIATYLEGLLVSLLRSVSAPADAKWNVSTLNTALENHVSTQVKRYVSAHLSEKLSLDVLSAQLHYSRSYLTSQFRKSEGMSITEYAHGTRLEAAKKLLARSSLSMNQIAEQTGFSTLQYFYKCFRDAEGCTPSAYREKIAASFAGKTAALADRSAAKK